MSAPTLPSRTSHSAGTAPDGRGPGRRSFLAWSAAVGGAGALVATAANLGMPTTRARAAEGEGRADVDATVWNACLANCQSRCPLRLQVKDGVVVRVLPDDTGSDEQTDMQIRACVRGRTQRQRIYSPDRIRTPLKRVGDRGSGEFEEISWDEALDTIASELTRVKDEYGNEAIWYHYGSGSTGGNITQRGSWPRLLNAFGGYLDQYGTYSTAQIRAGCPYTYGTNVQSNSIVDAKNSRLIVGWGNNPLETRMSGGGELHVTQRTREEAGVRSIVIDPRYSETALDVGDEWVPVRPGTDAALVAGMAHVMISEDLHDQAFLDRYCLGFDEQHMPEGAPANASYRAYLEGAGPDGIEKTPEWAAEICGVPATTIRRLAREIATTKPCAVIQGWGPQRHANGENQARAIMMIAIMTGNVGVTGGGTGTREGYYSMNVARYPHLTNPVKTQISCFNWIDAIDHGPEMTAVKDGVKGKEKLDVGIKLMVLNASNTLINQHNDIRVTEETMSDTSKCEFVVCVDHQMTPTAQWADIVLPATTNLEEEDLVPSSSSGEMDYVIWANKAIEPLYEARTGYDMCSDLAARLGLEDVFTEGRTQTQWRSHLLAQTREDVPDMPDEAELEEIGVWRKVNPEGTTIALKDFREDPEGNPLETESGKIEIYSAALQELADTWEFPSGAQGDVITALPVHVDTWEGALEARDNAEYPLQMISHHYKGRTHSSYANLAWIKEVNTQVVWINPQDAEPRGIDNDDLVDVRNERGVLRIPARVTPRIAPGVVSVPQGAWYEPDADGVDNGGCVNLLTKYHPSPLAKGNPGHTALVQIEKV